MPRKIHWGSGGAVGVEMTPLMVTYILTLTRWEDSRDAAKELCIDRHALNTMIKYIEAKVGRRLFIRRPGRGNALWLAQPAAADFFLWCEKNPHGGLYYPRRQ